MMTKTETVKFLVLFLALKFRLALAEERSACFEGRLFVLINARISFEAAKLDCDRRGMVLGGITSQAEQDCHLSLASGFLEANFDIWIGAL